MPWTDTVNPLDDKLHARTDDPMWNESSFVTFIVPERLTLGVLYTQFRPNMQLAIGGAFLADPSGEDIFDCAHWGYDINMPMPADAEMFDFDLVNGLSVRTIELQREYRYTYRHPNCEIDLTWTAAMEPFYMKLDGQQVSRAIRDWVDGIPDHITIGHYEQGGWMRGTITLGGETFEVDSPSLKDRTWGPRPIVTNKMRQRGGYPFVQASEDSSFQLFALSDLPHDEDPVIGTEEPVVTGWYTRDGVRSPIVSGVRRCVERAADGSPRREVIEAEDELGRELYAEAEVRTNFRWTGHSNCISQWGLAEWSYDGQTVWGESQDYLWFPHFGKLRRNARKLAETSTPTLVTER